MKAVILVATLKKEGQSNTEVLTEFFIDYLKKEKVRTEVIKLVDHNILPGTYLDMGKGDAWPEIFKKIKKADIIIFATPVWWGSQSSQMQMVFERLDEVFNEVEDGKESQLTGKSGGVIVTGEIDGAQNVIGNIGNFYTSIGIVFPPQCALDVIWEGHTKGEEKPRQELIQYYTEECADAAAIMAKNLVKYSGNK